MDNYLEYITKALVFLGTSLMSWMVWQWKRLVARQDEQAKQISDLKTDMAVERAHYEELVNDIKEIKENIKEHNQNDREISQKLDILIHKK